MGPAGQQQQKQSWSKALLESAAEGGQGLCPARRCAAPAPRLHCPSCATDWRAARWLRCAALCCQVRELYMDNHEIATHTMTHPALPSVDEIVGARKWLNEVRRPGRPAGCRRAGTAAATGGRVK